MKSSVRSRISLALRRSPMGEWLLDDFPTRVATASGHHLWATRRMARVLETFQLASPEAEMALRHYQGGDVVDVGAHHGAYCFMLAEKARPGATFIAFDPAPRAYPVLVHNVGTLTGLYPELRFVTLPLAVGNGSPCEFTFPMGEEYHPRVVSNAAGSNPVKTIRIDDAVSRFGVRPSFIKIDVEGAEVFVVEGMIETLRNCRPAILMEFHPLFQMSPEHPEQIVALFAKAGFGKAEEVHSPVTTQQLWLPYERLGHRRESNRDARD